MPLTPTADWWRRGGNIDQGFGTIQYGGKAGKKMDYRVYTEYFNQDRLPDSEGR